MDKRSLTVCGVALAVAVVCMVDDAPALASAPVRASDDAAVVALTRWVVLSAASGSDGGVRMARRVCTELRSQTRELERQRTAAAGATAITTTDVIYPRAGEERTSYSVELGLAFCDALDGKSLAPDMAAAVVKAPAGMATTFGAALERAKPFLPKPPGTTGASNPGWAPPGVTVNDTASVSARPGAPSLGFEISAGLATPLTAVGDVYGVAPALRVGFAMSRGSFQLTAHVEGFSGPLRATIYGVQRDSIFGYGGMDIEPMLRLMDGPVEIWCGARVAGGVLGRQISGLGSAGEERQATPFGFAGPLLRMDLPRAPLAPYLSVSSGVALTSTDGAARVNAHLSVWLGFRKELLSF